LQPDEQRIVRRLLEEDEKIGDFEEEPDHGVPKEEEEPLAIEEKGPLAIEEEGTQGDLFDSQSLHRDRSLFHARFRLSEWSSDGNGH
jgi:hypothetical protein